MRMVNKTKPITTSPRREAREAIECYTFLMHKALKRGARDHATLYGEIASVYEPIALGQTNEVNTKRLIRAQIGLESLGSCW